MTEGKEKNKGILSALKTAIAVFLLCAMILCLPCCGRFDGETVTRESSYEESREGKSSDGESQSESEESETAQDNSPDTESFEVEISQEESSEERASEAEISKTESSEYESAVLDEPSGEGSRNEVSEESGSDGEDSEEDSSEIDASEESGDAGDISEEPFIGEAAKISFLACPDNLLTFSLVCNAVEVAADAEGTEPDYTDFQNAAYDFSPIYENVAETITAADISFINVETLIGGNDSKITGFPRFNSPEAAGEALVDAGFDIYNLAHNHMVDSNSDKFLINCDRFFRERGKTTLGYYENKAATEDIVIVEQKGVKIAFLTYTYGTNISLSSKYDTYIPYAKSAFMEQQMKTAREKADIIIVSVHWGAENIFKPASVQRNGAAKLAELGADVIIGTHPHVIQEAEWLERPDGGRTLVTYSLGNFVSGMQGGKNMLGAMLSLDIVVDGTGARPYVDNVRLLPTVTHYERGRSVAEGDTGYRGFTIYPLEDYTEELAAAHGCRKNAYVVKLPDELLDRNFSKAAMIEKVRDIFPSEFLPEYFR